MTAQEGKKEIVKFNGKYVLLNVLYLNFRWLILQSQVRYILTALQGSWSCCSQKCATETWIIFFEDIFGKEGEGKENPNLF